MQALINETDNYLNTNEVINDYSFMYQIVYEHKPMDFEAVH
jgi:hypothetical protein